MKDKRYIAISEFGDCHTHKGEIPPEIIAAADDGIYDVIDITNPDAPMRYWDEGWTDVDDLPVSDANAQAHSSTERK